MLQRRVVKFDTKEQFNVSFFDDDTIEIVRQQIGIATDIHPNRLLIFARVKFHKEYYVEDPRRWEALFDRLSLNGNVLDKDIFAEFQTRYRFPNTSVPFEPYTKDDWMSVPHDIQKIFSPDHEFSEYRILGVDEHKSYILPFSGQHKRISQIQSTELPISELKKLFYNFYVPADIESFMFRPYTDADETIIRAYYPFLQTNTPSRITDETAKLLQTNAKLLNDLMEIKVPHADSVSIIRTKYIIPFVTTSFGPAVRSRFEQIFYGVTLSEEVPYVQLFTSKTESNRHKFYVKNPKQKTPFLDVVMLKQWLNETKPQRNRPTLMFYRGKSRNHYDKVAITATEIIVTVYRDTKNKQTLENIKKEATDWISQFDAVNSFVDPADLKEYRWVLDDMKFLAKYSDEIENLDLRRFNCISSFFGIIDKQNTFRMLRTDHSNDGISAIELRLLQMKKDQPLLTASDIQTELGIPKDKAIQLIDSLERRIEEDPSLTERAFRGFPILHVEPTSILFSFTDNLERSLKYANLLRYVLSNPKSKELDTICPKRMETIEVKSLIEPVFEQADNSEYDDLFAELEGDITEKKNDETSTVKTDTVRIGKHKDTLHSYFSTRLREFDPLTFSSPDYPRECERKRQPIIVTNSQIDEDYDPRKYLGEESIIEVKNPDGHVICPEYWCMKDLIPLRETELDNADGILKCPKCGGKIHKSSNDDIREFSLIKREQAYKYPGFKNSASVKFPCCFTTPQNKRALKKEEKEDDKYYILLEKRENIKPFRFAFLPKSLLSSLSINETYELLKNVNNRIQNGLAGYFRVGIGNAIETLPELLDIKTKISAPIDSVDTVLKCSFISTWKRTSTTHLERLEHELKDKISNELSRKKVAEIISGIQEAYEKKELSALHELEYATLFLQCDVFRIFTETKTMGCMFQSFMNRPKNRGIIILQNNTDIDILSNVRRIANLFKYRSNIYQTPFKKETQDEVERLRNLSCRTKIPNYNDALNAMPDLLTHLQEDTYQIILDPYGRGQAFFIKHKLILPFQSTPLPSVIQSKISGYNEIDTSEFPDYDSVRKYLIIAQGYSKGYAWREDVFDANNARVEIMTESGLPIAVKPEFVDDLIHETGEVTSTIQKYDESQLVFGEPSPELEEVRKNISYSAEVFEFLLFELSNDMYKDDEYVDLRNILDENHPSIKKVEPLLKKWFNKTTHFVDIDEPTMFLSKIRVPCGQFTKSKCNGALCGWDGNVCKTKIDKKLEKDRVFHRLLTTLVENVKIRSVVLDHRVTPFFSTILYLELPHELILSDSELSSD
jgi:hypothetical protein